MKKDYPLLKLKNVSKFYYNKGLVATGFTRVSLEFNLGEFVVITGESGSGKSTLLNVLSGLDSYEEGEMYINGEETSHYNDSDFEHYRKTYVGNIFQSFNLVGSYTVYQNIELVLLLNGFKKKDIKDKIDDLIKKVDLYKFRNTKVSKLSGGQKQRVAIARALAKDTPIIIADEPTGNLDSKSAKSIIKLLSEIAKEKLVVVVTHNYDQVEEYATRKIEMHDGKVREDIDLKCYETKEIKIHEFNDISLSNKILLGVRNTFNIFSKFILMFIVFLFIITAFLGEYSVFKNLAKEEAEYGYNAYFSNIDTNRIVLKKKDNTYFSDNDFKLINNLEGIASIETNDVLLDTMYTLNNDEYYLWGKFSDLGTIKKVDYGRLPENDNEVVIKGYRHDYYLLDIEELFDQDLMIYDDYGRAISSSPIKVVGVILIDTYEDYTFYAADNILDKIRLGINESYATLNLNINDNLITVGQYDYYMRLVPNTKVSKGQAVMSEYLNYYCKNYTCINSPLKVNVETIYYEENLDLVIKNTYNEKTFKNYTTEYDYEQYSNIIFISYEDYNSLYNKYTFQSSVFVDEDYNVDLIAQKLGDLGFTTLKIKDLIRNDAAGILEIINIFKLIVTIVLFIVLFFITYFVIKLIQKSKNIYYSTVRILGGSKKVIKSLISIELYTIYHLTFLIFMILTILVKQKIINIGLIKSITSNLTIKEFAIIYFILLVMSILLSYTYSRKLFTSSAMKSYREEV